MSTKSNYYKWISITILIPFLGLNVITYRHAYRFTHFSESDYKEHSFSYKLSAREKFKALFVGVANPRLVNLTAPARNYQKLILQSNKPLECWLMKADSAKGTIILFHGYRGKKSAMLDKADAFLKMHYNTLLVDFMGSGGSGGEQTTIGYKEAEEVKTSYNYLKSNGENNIILFGTSMGAVAILKALNDYKVTPSSIIIECPFGTMYQTVKARFKMMNIPSFPMAGMLMFWGGVQNGFWAFSHNPVEYARSVSCPVLLFYGEKDDRVNSQEINEVYNNLRGEKKIVTFPLAGHENYLLKYKKEWVTEVALFLKSSH